MWKSEDIPRKGSGLQSLGSVKMGKKKRKKKFWISLASATLVLAVWSFVLSHERLLKPSGREI